MTTKVMQAPFKYKRFTTDAINSYTGANGEPILDMRTASPVLRICDGVTQGCHLVGGSGVAGVAVPDIIAPVAGTTGVAVSPMITASAFFGVNGDGSSDSHLASIFNFYADAGKTSLIHSSGRLTTGDLTTYDTQGIYIFTYSTPIFIEVEYEGVSGNRSTSPLVHFKTLTEAPDQQLAKLLASDGDKSDYFAYSVDLSDNGLTAVIGAYGDDDKGSVAGAAYIFKKVSGVWTETAKLTASDGEAGDYLGRSVALSGDGLTAIIGAYKSDGITSGSGSAYIFTYQADTWTEVMELVADDGSSNDFFGNSVDISTNGLTAIVGAYDDDDLGSRSGSAYIFEKHSGTWSQHQKLKANDGTIYDYLARDVSLSGDGHTVIMGADGDDDLGSLSGSAYIFHKQAGTWSEIVKLTASDGDNADYFGVSVAISLNGQTAIVGAYKSGVSHPSGAAYIFKKISGVWLEIAKLTASDANSDDYFGRSVAISSDGLTVMIGAIADDDLGAESGSAYIFKEFNGLWAEVAKLTANDGASNDTFSYGIALSGDGSTAVVGAYGDDDKGSQSGSAYIFG